MRHAAHERRCWGIYRELLHSPGREADDSEILHATGRKLEAQGFEVAFKTPDELWEQEEAVPPFLFVMCERLEILDKLRRLEARGVRQVNSPRAVLNTYRDRMLALFASHSVPFPGSVLRETAAGLGAQAGLPPAPCWVKRGDVHNTQEGDVVFAPDRAAAERALEGLFRRGIERAVVQEHVPGDLIKFYGVAGHGENGGAPWFQWFYHKDQRLAGHRFDPALLGAEAVRAASALGLEVFGGDAIATADGRTPIIDLNAWPSFALFREEASASIAAYLAARFRTEVGVLK